MEEGKAEVGSTWSWSKAVRQVEAHSWQHPKGIGGVCCIMIVSRTVAMALVLDCHF